MSRPSSQRIVERRNPLGRHVVPAVLAAIFVLPLVYMVVGSLRARGLPPPQGIEFVPEGASLQAYRDLWAILPVSTYIRNSVLVIGMALPTTVLVASLTGYGIRILPRRGTRRAVIAVIALMLVPTTAVWATRFELFDLLGITNTLLPVASTALIATNPFYVLVYAWIFHQVSDEVLDAARIDGAGHLQIWWSIALPQVPAATLAVVTLAFAHHWGNFIDPLLYLKSTSAFTGTQGLRLLQQLNPTDWPLLMAGAVLLTVPPVLVFVVGQRRFLDDEVLSLRSVR